MKNKGLIATIVVLIAIIITLIAVVFLMQMPTILSSDGWASKFLNWKDVEVETKIDITESSDKYEETTVDVVDTEPTLTTTVENYIGYNNHASIDYPQIIGMSDVDMQDKINNKIKVNALSIVPLYPISTAIQKLTINCEVKSIDEEHITIVYEGRVVGSSGGSSSNTGGSSNTSKKSNVADPYLDGFVDPLSVIGQNNWQTRSIMPTESIANYYTPTTASYEAQITYNDNSNNKSSNSIGPNGASNVGTADKGPVVQEIYAPTAANGISSASEHSASNNPTGGSQTIYSGNYTSEGVYHSQSQTESIAPIETSSYNSTTYSLPVYGFANTNAKDINQRIYYTNTIDLKTGLDIKLSDYISDFDALAKYLRSSKVEFVNIDDSDKKAVREYINKTVQSKYVEQMKSADFRNEGVTSWPKIFSYRDSEGTVYFSVKLSSKLGNYAIVKYEN